MLNGPVVKSVESVKLDGKQDKNG